MARQYVEYQVGPLRRKHTNEEPLKRLASCWAHKGRFGFAFPHRRCCRLCLESVTKMEWFEYFPIVMLPLKLLVVGIGMYYSIKWHYDQGKLKRAEDEKRKHQMAVAAKAAQDREIASAELSQPSP